MKPSIGRIVIYHGSGEDAAAIITKVHHDSCVNLRVFSDGQGCFHLSSVFLGSGLTQWSWPERV